MASDYPVELRVPLAARERESELVARAVSGDHQAYATLVRPHEGVAYRVAAASSAGTPTPKRRPRTAS